jgi:hypothetical protein
MTALWKHCHCPELAGPDKLSMDTRCQTAIIVRIMPASPSSLIPNRVETLRVLRLMGDYEPILMLTGSDDGYGTRWTLGGQQVQPAIARYLIESGFVAENGKTQFGAKTLALTADGARFRERGVLWWAGLSIFQKLKITLLG